tara:strand:+ start:733 stop:1680 length:948 start_codon:yes stop_codon:yes gene_type:complete
MKKAFIQSVINISKKNKNIVFISVDQPTGYEKELKNSLGERFLVEPISESNVIGMASGLSSEGYIPIVFNHATFNTRRCYEQILLDCCLQNRKIILFSMGAGLATSHLGPSHTSLDDIGLMRLIPNMDIAVPCNSYEVKKLTPQILKSKNSCYLRIGKYGIPKNGINIDQKYFTNYNFKKILLVTKAHKKNEIALISTGITTPIAIEVNYILKKNNIKSEVYHTPSINPKNNLILKNIFLKSKKIVFLEEHYEKSGLANAIIDKVLFELKFRKLPEIHRFAIPSNKFVKKYGNQDSVLDFYGISKNNILKSLGVI